MNLIEEHKIEKWYGDLSRLLDYLEARKIEVKSLNNDRIMNRKC